MEISAVIITRNEEKRLEAALGSLSGVADEVIVVDCLSTDHTLKIAWRHTPHVFEREWTDFADQKNYAAGLDSRPWVLSLDADERLSPELHHFPFAGVAEHAARVNEFSGLEAQKLYASGRKVGWRHVVCEPPAATLRSYFLKHGFLDGFPGLVIAGTEAYRVFLLFVKLKEVWRKGERIEPLPY